MHLYHVIIFVLSERINMSTGWCQMLDDTSSMSNVTIVCSDGIIQTHKIVIASASDFLKHLLSDIPVGDETTLYLPDHEKTSVLGLINGVFSQENQENAAESGLFSEPVLFKTDDIKEELPFPNELNLVEENTEFKDEAMFSSFKLCESTKDIKPKKLKIKSKPHKKTRPNGLTMR